jgi:uncharacterized protein YggE
MKHTLFISWLAASFAVLAPGATLAAKEGAGEGILTVNGSASLQVDANLASIGFGVEIEAASATEALAANTARMTEVIEGIRRAGVDESEISTSQFSIGPVYDRQQDRASGVFTQVLRGYRVSNLVNVETPRLDIVAEVIDAAVAAGANRVERISFGLSPDVFKRSREQLIEAAVNNAREKASMALAPLDYKITGVKNMSVSEQSQPAPLYAERMRMDVAASSAPPVFAGDQAVRTTVNVTFQIGAR